MNNVKKPAWLMIIRAHASQYAGDNNNPNNPIMPTLD